MTNTNPNPKAENASKRTSVVPTQVASQPFLDANGVENILHLSCFVLSPPLPLQGSIPNPAYVASSAPVGDDSVSDDFAALQWTMYVAFRGLERQVASAAQILHRGGTLSPCEQSRARLNAHEVTKQSYSYS